MNQQSPSSDSQQAIEIARTAVTEKQLSESALTNLQRWLTEPQYAAYLPALLKLIADKEFGTLDTYFWEVIPFGTGGRRGLMSDFGSATINERTIAESAHGLAVYFKNPLVPRPAKQLLPMIRVSTQSDLPGLQRP